MKIKFGLISSDSHAQLDQDTWTRRMSKEKWGDRIPHVIETKEDGYKHPVHRWMVNGKLRGGFVANCPAIMPGGVAKAYYPQRWEEVPKKAYDPLERLKALDHDRVDGEVLFPNTPVQNGTFFEGDAAFELDCVRAHNDALAEWRQASKRYIPIAIIPYLSPIEVTVAEVERAAKLGHRGINMLAQPSLTKEGLKPFTDPHWERLWAACQACDMPVHWHGSAGLAAKLALPKWKGYSKMQAHTVSTSRLCATPAQLIPSLLFSGILDRYPRLKWVCAETGLGWVNYVLESCDHEWERRHLWTEGMRTRPSEIFRRQVYVDFWFEEAGIELRHNIGIDNIMWESDYPHIASTYPYSWKFIKRTLKGVPEDESQKLLYGNALKLYRAAA